MSVSIMFYHKTLDNIVLEITEEPPGSSVIVASIVVDAICFKTGKMSDKISRRFNDES